MSPGPDSEPPLLSMRGISKRFPGVVALENVSLTLEKGEVLALMGENGAGKSTLMKILGGATQPDEGEIRVAGKAVAFANVREAKAQGIALIHQELMLAPNLDVTSNIFLGNERAGRGLLRPLDRRRLRAAAELLVARVGLQIPVTTLVSELTAGQKQMVEIAKALSANAQILIMDEPTSSLGSEESEQLFEIIHQLRSQGIGIIYISHRMGEVLALSDRITVLRDGRHVSDLLRANATHDAIVALMVGRALSGQYFPPKREHHSDEIRLAVESLRLPGVPHALGFSARRGEILGFAGLIGAGRTELMQAIFGVAPAVSGQMLLDGKGYSPRTARDAIARGVYLAPEDRKQHGLVLPMSVAENSSLPNVASYARFGWLDRVTEQKVAEAGIKRLRTKTPSIHQIASNLSGGNQQKVVLAKWLAMSPKILILDEPTRGIDVGAKAEIYQHMADLADEGITILMVSSDLEEIMGVSDRVVVMHERRITGVLEGSALTQLGIAGLMTGRPANSGGSGEAVAS